GWGRQPLESSTASASRIGCPALSSEEERGSAATLPEPSSNSSISRDERDMPDQVVLPIHSHGLVPMTMEGLRRRTETTDQTDPTNPE
ncbi:MAG: hypothetical protein EBZ29_12240, partial [Synechococcaceae bacterium WB9_4xC_028]|nr:hypothetical protein [Synechococcaceae bacterium WB9_4xC_028]